LLEHEVPLRPDVSRIDWHAGKPNSSPPRPFWSQLIVQEVSDPRKKSKVPLLVKRNSGSDSCLTRRLSCTAFLNRH